MSLWVDRRGQSVVIGSLLIFTFLILAFSSYQAFVVPSQNQQVEAEHFQETEEQFSMLRSEVVNSVDSGETRSTAVELGVEYPTRRIALNPPPAAGRLATTDPGDVEFDTGEDVCRDGGTPTTRSLVYTPGYNEYEAPEALGYENRVVSREFRSGRFDEQRLVRESSGGNDRISLFLLTGEVSETGIAAYSLEVNGSGQHTITLTDPTITIPSRFDATTWENEILADRSDVTVTPAATGDRVELDFDGGDYEVSCAVVGLDSDPAFTPPADDGGGGGGGGGGDSEFGQGGEETWTLENDTRPVSTQGGLWQGVDNVNSIQLSDPRLSSINPVDLSTGSQSRYFFVGFTVGDAPGGNRRYSFIVPETPPFVFVGNDTTGSSATFRANSEMTIKIFEEGDGIDGKPTELTTATIPAETVNDWYLDGEPIDLLDITTYNNPDRSTEESIAEVRSYLRENTDQEAYVTDISGRTNLSLTRVPELKTEDVRDLGNEDAEYDYEPEIDIAEVGQEEAENVETRLVITNDNDNEVFNESQSLGNLEDETATATFDVGSLDSGDYSYTVTANATNANERTDEGDFSVDKPDMSDRVQVKSGSEGTVSGTGNSGITFTMENVESGDTTVTEVAVDDTSSADYVENDGGITFRTEGGDTLYADRLNIGAATESLDNTLDIDTGEEVTLELGQFRDGAGNRGRVGMGGEDVTITFVFSDDSEDQYVVSIP